MPSPTATTGSYRFETTRWNIVVEAGRTGNPGALDALEQLCGVYQYPIYAEIRRRGHPPCQTEDLAQGFFERLLGGQFFELADPAKGRFRSYLLKALNFYLLDVAKSERALRRGGGLTPVALDGLESEERYQLEPKDAQSPDVIYERRFATALLDQVLRRLEQEFLGFGSAALFQRLQDYLAADGPSAPSYAEVGAELGLSVDALKSAMYRLRRRYRELLREEIRQIVAREEDVEDEVNHLFRVLSG